MTDAFPDLTTQLESVKFRLLQQVRQARASCHCTGALPTGRRIRFAHFHP